MEGRESIFIGFVTKIKPHALTNSNRKRSIWLPITIQLLPAAMEDGSFQLRSGFEAATFSPGKQSHNQWDSDRRRLSRIYRDGRVGQRCVILVDATTIHNWFLANRCSIGWSFWWHCRRLLGNTSPMTTTTPSWPRGRGGASKTAIPQAVDRGLSSWPLYIATSHHLTIPLRQHKIDQKYHPTGSSGRTKRVLL